jgi:hypothetical protein
MRVHCSLNKSQFVLQEIHVQRRSKYMIMVATNPVPGTLSLISLCILLLQHLSLNFYIRSFNKQNIKKILQGFIKQKL